MNTQEQHSEEISQTNDLFSSYSDDQTVNKEDISKGDAVIAKDEDDFVSINDDIEKVNNAITIVNDTIAIVNDSIEKYNNETQKEIEDFAKGFNEASLLAVYEPEYLDLIRETVGSNEYNDGFKAGKEYHSKEKEQEENVLTELETLRNASQSRNIELEL